MNKSIDYIENESFVIVNPDYPVISKENAIKAVEIAEEEVRKKALQAYCLDSCLVHDVNDIEKILSCCNEECPIVSKFIKNLE